MMISQSQMIMKSNELMIGNYVRNNHHPFAVNFRIFEVTHIEYTLTGIHPLDGKSDQLMPTGKLGGVPITEEMLEKLGFERNPDSEYFEYDKHYRHPDLKPPYLLTTNFSVFESVSITTYKKDWILTKFSYVHELQNWWFSICKTQLKFQE